MDKLIGKTLNERYILTEIVGVGGMAVVYKAFDQVVNRIVAVKILKEEFMSDAQFRRRFTNESKAITMLSQNNIVDVYDVCLEGDLMYLVMEYIDGITLKEYLDKVKVIEWHEASFYIKQILKAMSHAHERGIVHRDLKPHNIMLLRDGTIKVTDFGIAKLTKFDTHTITDKAIGSVHYISPEQASGDRTDEKTDIYSVGVMFYEMLTGTLPFVGDSAVSVALMQVQAQPKLPREINSNIPEGIEEITIKAMMKDPSVRYSSALAMFNDIVSVEETPDLTFGYLFAGVDATAPADDPSDNSPTQFVDINSLNGLESEYEQQPAEQENDEESDEQEEQENAFKATWLPILLGVFSAIVVVFAVILMIVFWHEITQFFNPNKDDNTPQQSVEMVTVDTYVGKDFSEVEKNNPNGFVFKRENAISDQKAGTIVSQDPAPGTEVEKGSEILLKVSIGKETDSIPDLTMMHYSAAFSKMNEVGIKFTTAYISSETVPENYVIRTSPQGGEEATSETIVKIYISTGAPIVTKTVPDLLNNTEADAVKKLDAVGLKADIKYVFNDKVAKDCVISQNPSAGEKVNEGSTVIIEVSKGKNEDNDKEPGADDKPMDEMIEIPDISNDTEKDAVKKLEDLELKAEVEYQFSNKVTKDYIISFTPSAGTSVTHGSTVKIVVSKGPEVSKVPVPSLNGKTEADAKKALEDVGLKADVQYEFNDTVEKDVVISQTVAAETEVDKGSTVTIVVSKGPETTEPDVPAQGDGENSESTEQA